MGNLRPSSIEAMSNDEYKKELALINIRKQIANEYLSQHKILRDSEKYNYCLYHIEIPKIHAVILDFVGFKNQNTDEGERVAQLDYI
ncbi:MAG: hypothetical protein HQL68_06560 [Magnetococcales bacterium]|nr:hypothetical protein [Magnetococcales bacterium]